MTKIARTKRSEDILEHALASARKTADIERQKLKHEDNRKQIFTLVKIKTFTEEALKDLNSLKGSYESFDSLPEFYKALVDMKVGKKKYSEALKNVSSAAANIAGLKVKYGQKTMIADEDELEKILVSFYGRASKELKGVKNDLELVAEVSKEVNTRGGLRVGLPTVVIAGFPNVGKSTILSKVSRSKPQIASYPFTTKSINIGHVEKEVDWEKKTLQLVDTPGLLERPLDKRNEIEKEAVLALKHLADKVLFVFDASGTSGYEIADQERLLEDVRKTLKKETLLVLNKKDVTPSEAIEAFRQRHPDALIISAESPEDCEKVKDWLMKAF